MATTVLVVDDHPGFRAGARKVLEAEGFEVVGEAADAVSGIAAARELKPDIVLMDVRLPDIDGMRASERIALNGRSAIVLVSSHDIGDLGGPEAVSDTPVVGFIPKSELSGDALRALLASPR